MFICLRDLTSLHLLYVQSVLLQKDSIILQSMVNALCLGAPRFCRICLIDLVYLSRKKVIHSGLMHSFAIYCCFDRKVQQSLTKMKKVPLKKLQLKTRKQTLLNLVLRSLMKVMMTCIDGVNIKVNYKDFNHSRSDAHSCFFCLML